MYQPKRKRKISRKKNQGLDLTNAAVKRKSSRAAEKSISARAGDIALFHGRDAELLDPPIYRVERTRRGTEPSPGTEF
ncbi:hypothetical protein FYJ63_06965 [Mobiluncus holmesii]|uniref:Uncharacterized protein n=1 Tax=Mobiluncus porci TaxID=2652278 RepID=A0A7K0K4M2_9ACTO|nr:hypothetical protein [Mobiluncus porci]